MECEGLARSSGVTRIPVKFSASSTCSSRHNKQSEASHEPRQARYHHHHHHHLQQQQQQQAGMLARGSRASSINGRLTSLPPSRPRHTAKTLLDHNDRDYSGQRSRIDATPPIDACRSSQWATRGRSVSDVGRTTSAGAGDALHRSLVMSARTGRRGYWSADDSGDDEDASSALSLQTRSPDWSTPGTYRVEFDVETGYAASDINIKISSDGRLVVHGVRRQTDGTRTSTTEFCRKIRLPDDVDPASVDCYLQPGGRLVVEAPRPPRSAPPAVEERLNVPIVTGDDGRQLGLMVELGRLFRADDVVVKVKNSALTLTVVAERTETVTARSGRRLKAGVTWEFDLPGTVEVDTLRAALTTDGLLRVSARLTSPLPLPPSQSVNSAV